MLEPLFGSRCREDVLQFILANDSGYGTEIKKFYNTGLDPIQKQLEKLELGGVLVSKNIGKTVVYSFNPRYAFLDELKSLLLKAREFYKPELIEQLTMSRKRPRRQ
ncbi:MAG: ArsR family transcriptional regulator, partial [Campylobacterota bacterium]|nr:ArsR family transcriptional regulator [Campylobacterota bacterium]